MSASVATQLLRYRDGRRAGQADDVLAAEEPLEIRVEGRSLAVVMRTPGHDRELAAGFLLSEGVIRSAREIFDITSCVTPNAAGKGNAVDVGLTNPASLDPDRLSRHVFTSASCGICGKTTIEAVMRRSKPLVDDLRVSSRRLFSLPGRLAREQATFQSTGGLHACALFDAKGALIAVREDVGRHNALDKLIGLALLQKMTPLRKHLVLLSGRASFEMMQKAHAGGIAFVAAISAPSSLAVDFARESGQTLIGFLRGKSMNVYAGAERIR